MATAFQLRRAASILRAGGIILYPTDTVYGLGCDPADAVAVARIYSLKRRNPGKSLILVAGERAQLAGYVDDEIEIASSPQTPTTWVVPAGADCPPWLTADDGSIAVRLSAHPVITTLCGIVESPLVSTSANLSGRRTVNDSASIHRTFHDRVDAILVDDNHSTGRPSVIRHLHDDNIIRA